MSLNSSTVSTRVECCKRCAIMSRLLCANSCMDASKQAIEMSINGISVFERDTLGIYKTGPAEIKNI